MPASCGERWGKGWQGGSGGRGSSITICQKESYRPYAVPIRSPHTHTQRDTHTSSSPLLLTFPSPPLSSFSPSTLFLLAFLLPLRRPFYLPLVYLYTTHCHDVIPYGTIPGEAQCEQLHGSDVHPRKRRPRGRERGRHPDAVLRGWAHDRVCRGQIPHRPRRAACRVR